MLALVPGADGGKVTATPEGIAKGKDDRFLFLLTNAIAAYPGSLFYLRPLPEMNGHWNSNCAYNANGSLRPSYDSTAWTRKALARIAIITRGGAADDINAKLARLGLPQIHRGDLPDNTAKLQIVWNPQGFGSPDVPGNSANAYYPGRRVCRCRRRRPLRHRRARRYLGRGAGALQIPSLEGVRLRRMGLVGDRRPVVRAQDGLLRSRPSPSCPACVVQRQARVDLRSPQQAELRCGVPQVHLVARLDVGPFGADGSLDVAVNVVGADLVDEPVRA